jgi:hypothetical protein
MTDFETHPRGTAAELKMLRSLHAPKTYWIVERANASPMAYADERMAKLAAMHNGGRVSEFVRKGAEE